MEEPTGPPTLERDPAVFYAAAIYGSLLAASLIAVFRVEHDSSKTTALALLGTMAVFWLAHAWSQVLGERIHRGKGIGRHGVFLIARAEWPIVEAAFAPAFVLLLGWVGFLGTTTAETLALSVCIFQLFAWGFAVGRKAYAALWAAIAAGIADGLLGLGLVWLEITVVHH